MPARSDEDNQRIEELAIEAIRTLSELHDSYTKLETEKASLGTTMATFDLELKAIFQAKVNDIRQVLAKAQKLKQLSEASPPIIYHQKLKNFIQKITRGENIGSPIGSEHNDLTNHLNDFNEIQLPEKEEFNSLFKTTTENDNEPLLGDKITHAKNQLLFDLSNAIDELNCFETYLYKIRCCEKQKEIAELLCDQDRIELEELEITSWQDKISGLTDAPSTTHQQTIDQLKQTTVAIADNLTQQKQKRIKLCEIELMLENDELDQTDANSKATEMIKNEIMREELSEQDNRCYESYLSSAQTQPNTSEQQTITAVKHLAQKEKYAQLRFDYQKAQERQIIAKHTDDNGNFDPKNSAILKAQTRALEARELLLAIQKTKLGIIHKHLPNGSDSKSNITEEISQTNIQINKNNLELLNRQKLILIRKSEQAKRLFENEPSDSNRMTELEIKALQARLNLIYLQIQIHQSNQSDNPNPTNTAKHESQIKRLTQRLIRLENIESDRLTQKYTANQNSTLDDFTAIRYVSSTPNSLLPRQTIDEIKILKDIKQPNRWHSATFDEPSKTQIKITLADKQTTFVANNHEVRITKGTNPIYGLKPKQADAIREELVDSMVRTAVAMKNPKQNVRNRGIYLKHPDRLTLELMVKKSRAAGFVILGPNKHINAAEYRQWRVDLARTEIYRANNNQTSLFWSNPDLNAQGCGQEARQQGPLPEAPRLV